MLCMFHREKTNKKFATLDDTQSLHVRSISVGESPRRICHLTAGAGAFAVLTTSISIRGGGTVSSVNANLTIGGSGENGEAEEVEVSHLRLFDDETFELLDSFAFDASESAMSIAVFKSGGGDSFLVVGTVIARPYEEQAKDGRIRLFKVERDFEKRRVALETTLDVGGCVYSVLGLKGRIFAGINNKVFLPLCLFLLAD